MKNIVKKKWLLTLFTASFSGLLIYYFAFRQVTESTEFKITEHPTTIKKLSLKPKLKIKSAPVLNLEISEEDLTQEDPRESSDRIQSLTLPDFVFSERKIFNINTEFPIENIDSIILYGVKGSASFEKFKIFYNKRSVVCKSLIGDLYQKNQRKCELQVPSLERIEFEAHPYETNSSFRMILNKKIQ